VIVNFASWSPGVVVDTVRYPTTRSNERGAGRCWARRASLLLYFTSGFVLQGVISAAAPLAAHALGAGDRAAAGRVGRLGLVFAVVLSVPLAAAMVIAGIGYWGIGFVGGWLLAFPLGYGAIGLWWGLALGLAVVAILLGMRLFRLGRSTTPSVLPRLRAAGKAWICPRLPSPRSPRARQAKSAPLPTLTL